MSAAADDGAVIPLYIHDDAHDPYPHGAASRWWLQESLRDLGESLNSLGAPLILRHGDTLQILRDIIKQTGAKTVRWNRRYEPALAAYDKKLARQLETDGVTTHAHEGFLLFDPDSIKTGGGSPYKVFTPFSKACFAASPPAKPIPAPKKLTGIDGIKSDRLEDLKLVPRRAKWPKGFADAWAVSESAAQAEAKKFLKQRVDAYKNDRNRPDHNGTSRMSPYLHFGQVSPHQLWNAAHHVRQHGGQDSSVERYLLEILWREFSWQLLHHFPELPRKNLVPSFNDFPWRTDKVGLKAWQKGETGYPIIDAGMRQLWQTGWMHNRVRMVVASFLIKDLLIDWREGAAWFWDTLVDADLGNNSASWQWVAGCGADAAPFYRIFNPMLQGEKFDPDGKYVREFVPELAKLDTKYIHAPWTAPASVLADAKITLGKTYPQPIVEHDKARKRALAALKATKGEGGKISFGDDEKNLFD